MLVVGAGPAGMECAIVLAKRGFGRVHVVTADAEIGGIMRWVPRLPGLGEWGRVLDWRRIQLQKLRRQVELITGERLTAADVRDYGAELVVIATGVALVAGRPERRHARADPRRRRVAAALPDARAGDARGQAAAGLARRRLRLRRLLRRRRASPSCCAPRAAR